MGSSHSGGEGPHGAGDLPRWAAESAAAPPDLELLRAALERGLADEHGPGAWLRSRSTPARFAIAGSAVMLIGVTAALGWARPDLEVYPPARMWLVLTVITALIALDVTLCLWPLHRPAPPPWTTRVGVWAAPLGLLALYALPAAHTRHAASLQARGAGALLERALPCLGIGTFVACAAFLLLRSLDRGGSSRPLLMAAAGGLVANLLLQLHCAVTAPPHMLLGHLGVSLLVLGGIVLLERALAR